MPAGYLSAAGIESCILYLANTYPTICQLILLPERTEEGRRSRAIKIAKGRGANRRGVLFIGGVHAREIVNPDLLVTLALRLLNAYSTNSALNIGGKNYSAGIVKMLVENLDIFIFPLVNPDGRVHVQTPPPAGEAMWRKNRSVNAGSSCRGIDLNRNYDHLHNSGIGTSAAPCSHVFKGPLAFSEPETRNVRHLLDTYANIGCMIDVHSFSELILYPWGDDEVQTTDPSQNFQNPVYDGLRGTVGSGYREYMEPDDLNQFVDMGNQLRDAISVFRGRVYTVQQSIYLYPTSATSRDYAYGRHLVDASKRKVFSYTLETGTEFQPPFAEGQNVMEEVSAGLLQFCISCLCTVEATAADSNLADRLDDLRVFRDVDLKASARGRQYLQIFETHSAELLEKIADDPKFRAEALEILEQVEAVIQTRDKAKPQVFSPALIDKMDKTALALSKGASPELKKSLALVQQDLKLFSGKTVTDGLGEDKKKKLKDGKAG